MYGQAWMRASMKSRQQADQATRSPRDELQMYLSSPLEEVDDVIAWWGVSPSYSTMSICHSTYFIVPFRRLQELRKITSLSRVRQFRPNVLSQEVELQV